MKLKRLSPGHGVLAYLLAIGVWAYLVLSRSFEGGDSSQLTMCLILLILGLPLVFFCYRLDSHLRAVLVRQSQSPPHNDQPSQPQVNTEGLLSSVAVQRCLITTPIGVAVLLTLAVTFVRVLDGRIACRERICRVRMAVLAENLRWHHSLRGRLPAAVESDNTTSFPWSWRMTVLSEIEPERYVTYSEVVLDREIPRSYQKSEPWDSPANRRLLREQSASIYTCPASAEPIARNATSYVAVIGEETFWPGTKRRRIPNVTEEIEDKILLIEVPHADIPWIEPRDIHFLEAIELFNALREREHPRHPDGLHYVTFGKDVGTFSSIESVEQFADMLRLPPGSYTDESDGE